MTLRTPGDRRETKEGAERPDLTKGTPRYTSSSTKGRGVSYNWRRPDEDGSVDEEDEDDDEDDEEDDEEDEEEEVRSLVIGHTTLFSFVVGYDRGAEDGRGEADVLHFRCPYVRAACTSSLP